MMPSCTPGCSGLSNTINYSALQRIRRIQHRLELWAGERVADKRCEPLNHTPARKGLSPATSRFQGTLKCTNATKSTAGVWLRAVRAQSDLRKPRARLDRHHVKALVIF